MKCDKCGYDFGDSGAIAHACAFYQTLKPSKHETHLPERAWIELDDDEQFYFEHAKVPRNQLLKWATQRLKEKNHG